jgi:putative heme transporter
MSSRDGRPESSPHRPGGLRRALRPWRRWAPVVACVVLLGMAVHAEEPMIAESLRSFAHLRWWPAALAVAAETASMVALGLMERRILILAGLRLPVGRSVAIAYASNALSASLPVIGSGAATAFTYRRLVSQGATPTLAGWALVLAGAVSNAAFVLIISIGAVVSGNLAAIWAGGAGILLTFAVIGVAALAMRRPGARERVSSAAIWTLDRVQHLVRRPAGDAAGIVADVTAGLAAFRPNRGDVILAVVSAVRNWTFDLFCLVFSLKAAGVQVPWWGIILAWAAGTGGATLNLTPGGLGVVEAALTGALVALGVPGAPALTAVLIYRAITFWLAIAVGWAIYLYLRRDREPAPASPRP